MARKSLLTEAELRSFMKLAELRPLGDDRINEMYGEIPDVNEEDDPEELEKFAADDMGDDTMMGDEEAADDELEADAEMDLDMPPGDGAGAGMVSVDDFMGALEAALEDVLGEPVSTEMDDEMDADDDMEDADAMAMDADMETDMALDDEEEELPGMRDMYESQEDLVNEVAKRVAVRLKAKNNKENMVDALAERIMKRLTK